MSLSWKLEIEDYAKLKDGKLVFHSKGERLVVYSEHDKVLILSGDQTSVIKREDVHISVNNTETSIMISSKSTSLYYPTSMFKKVKKLRGREHILATQLHDKLCRGNHIDDCSWHYEIVSDVHNWDEYEHNKWLTKANKIINNHVGKVTTEESIMEIIGILRK